MRLVGRRYEDIRLSRRPATGEQTERGPASTADSRRVSRGASPQTSILWKGLRDHLRSKNQLERLPDASCNCTPATFAFAGPSDPPPPRSGFAMRDPPKLKPPLPSMAGRPRVEPCFAASRRSFTAVSWASNLNNISQYQ